ncbi:hypothetical protein N658DRAFT_248712 [Parathielavia hyrcaniae]|uniref:Uncharacterized protein n=1 Tax=Parathielavia hyrcaniae TaxID=113614 RepID=A0AAN6Q7D6_9PEZI|nr:hypothetical protein N658DRAFT_248712 [Parathielavia hyrcaniae]
MSFSHLYGVRLGSINLLDGSNCYFGLVFRWAVMVVNCPCLLFPFRYRPVRIHMCLSPKQPPTVHSGYVYLPNQQSPAVAQAGSRLFPPLLRPGRPAARIPALLSIQDKRLRNWGQC